MVSMVGLGGLGEDKLEEELEMAWKREIME